MSESPASAAPRGTLTAQFGLDAAEAALLRRLLGLALGAMGLDGERIASRLDEGGSLREALGVPAETAELLYARAHRWFGVGRIDKAEPLFRTLCILAGESDHWVGYGVCLALRGADRDAANALTTAAKLRPGWAIPHFHLAGLAIRAAREDEAALSLAAFERVATPDLPAEIRAEAERMRLALALRRGDPAASGT